MKPLVEITDKNKETKFNLYIYDILDSIDKKANKYFDDAFINKKDYISEDILIDNLKTDIDYMLSQCIWLINLGKALGYSMEVERFVQTKYDTYTSSELGYRNLVTDKRYNKQSHSVYTAVQVIENEKRSNEIMLKILSEI